MGKDRLLLPNDLGAKVMFASDRTCCVCKDPNRKTQIHHIDEDPTNNSFENLAVLCNDCHSDAHTVHAFARNLGSEVIRLYNDSWRAIVKVRLGSTVVDPQTAEYRQEVLLHLSLIPHEWKNTYMALYPGHFMNTGYVGAVWDMMIESAQHQYSQEEWRRYLTLFDSSVLDAIRGIEKLIGAYGDAVSSQVKLSALRTTQALNTERFGYLTLPGITDHVENADHFFSMRFVGVIGTLRRFEEVVNSDRRSLSSGD